MRTVMMMVMRSVRINGFDFCNDEIYYDDDYEDCDDCVRRDYMFV